MTTKKKRGRPAPPRGIDICPSCGRKVKYKLFQRQPCVCGAPLP